MKVPSPKRLKEAQRSLRTKGLYPKILRFVCVRYARIAHDRTPLDLLQREDWPAFYAYADGLSGQLYPDAAKHFAAHQLSALVKKYPWDPKVVNLDPERAATESFNASEHRCKRVNQWFQALRSPRNKGGREIHGLLSDMRQWIRYVINDKPNLRRVYDHADITGGATLCVSGDATNLGRKLTAERWTCTPTALPYFAAALSSNHHYVQKVAHNNGLGQFSLHVSATDIARYIEIVHASKLAFVPKTAKTFRSINVEPLGNGLVQKGAGEVLRLNLKRVGLDLTDQTLNQRMAHEGSLDESEDGFCTIDLASASDSVSIGLVQDLLPSDWFNFLNRIRSPSYRLPKGSEQRFSKFCSMGNGFCFPLETLLFAAVCVACKCGVPGRDFAVYGDDIVVRRKSADKVIRLLARLGFKCNSRKTFVTGPFRESCGANWYRGDDVTPFTLDFPLNSLQGLFKFANLSRRNARSREFFSDVLWRVIRHIPDDFRFFRPFRGAADTGIDPWEVEFTSKYWERNKAYQCSRWLELESRPAKDAIECPPWVVMTAALRGSKSEAPFTYRRKSVTRVRVIARSGGLDPPSTNPALNLQARLPRWNICAFGRS